MPSANCIPPSCVAVLLIWILPAIKRFPPFITIALPLATTLVPMPTLPLTIKPLTGVLATFDAYVPTVNVFVNELNVNDVLPASWPPTAPNAISPIGILLLPPPADPDVKIALLSVILM